MSLKNEKEPLVQVTHKLRYSQIMQLEELHEQTRVTKAVLFREAIDDLLHKYGIKAAA